MRGIKLFQEGSFILWLTPEKFLHYYWTNQLAADIENNITNFTKYNVHYVGKATEQDIWKRLTGHSTLQDILSLENPMNYGSLPTEEIVLLLFRFYDNLAINTYKADDNNIQDMVASVLGTNRPEEKTIYHDAEKALVKSMQPKYNKEVYKSYPNSKDGLQKHDLDHFSYTFMDPITLIYSQGEIVGGIDALGGDRIWIADNKSLKIYKS